MLKDEGHSYTVDWWSLGILAFLLMVGYLPFRSGNRQRLFDMIQNQEVKIPPNIDPTSASLIQALLTKDPAKRLGAIGTDVTSHPYFKDLSWRKVAKMSYDPPFVPYISRPESVSNFDEELTRQPASDSFVEQSPLYNVQNFSYEGDLALMTMTSFDDLSSNL
jgi:serum/glucocorticoid-regulated kinase 2